MKKYIYLLILLLMCSHAYASYTVEVLKVTKFDGFKTFTLKITDDGTGDVRVGERMFSPGESIPSNQGEVDAMAAVLYPQFYPEVEYDDSTAFETSKKKFIDDLPSVAELNAITNLADAKAELINMRKAIMDLAKIVQDELR